MMLACSHYIKGIGPIDILFINENIIDLSAGIVSLINIELHVNLIIINCNTKSFRPISLSWFVMKALERL